MGKKSKAKEFRRIAAQLPTLHQEAIQKNVVTGHHLLTLGMSKFADGSSVEADKTYMNPEKVLVKVNHARRLRKHVEKFGQAGMIGYVRSVNKYVQENSDKVKENSDKAQQNS